MECEKEENNEKKKKKRGRKYTMKWSNQQDVGKNARKGVMQTFS